MESVMPTLYDADGNEVEVPENISEMRDQLETALKTAKEAEKARVAAEKVSAPILAERREQAAVTFAAEASLPESAARAWLRLNPEGEPTAEGIATLATELGIEAASTPEQPDDAPARQGLPSVRPDLEGDSVGPNATKVPVSTVRQLIGEKRMQKAHELISQGRVDFDPALEISETETGSVMVDMNF